MKASFVRHTSCKQTKLGVIFILFLYAYVLMKLSRNFAKFLFSWVTSSTHLLLLSAICQHVLELICERQHFYIRHISSFKIHPFILYYTHLFHLFSHTQIRSKSYQTLYFQEYLWICFPIHVPKNNLRIMFDLPKVSGIQRIPIFHLPAVRLCRASVQ